MDNGIDEMKWRNGYMGIFGKKGKTVELEITGVTCGHCVNTVTMALEAVDGAKKAKVNLKGNALITIQEGTDPPLQELVKAVAEAGNFTAQVK